MTTPIKVSTLSEEKLNAFVGKVIDDFGASLSTTLVYIGLKLGLYQAMAGAGPLLPSELAERTGTVERYIREWLMNQAAGGYISYDSKNGPIFSSAEQAMVLADEESPFYAGGGFYVVKAMNRAEERIADSFRSGGGILWEEQDPDLFVGTERFFRPAYAAHLVSEWIPSLTDVAPKLKKGAWVADVGCGHGASTLLLAKAYPASRFFGCDNHPPSIDHARKAASEAGLSNRITFEIAEATHFSGDGFDLIAFFDCLHDMGDPLGALRHAYERLSPDGTLLIVEPMAGNTVEENFNPIGRTFSAASTLCCTANSMALGGPALGAVATEEAIRGVVLAAGFSHLRRTAQTPFNRIFEARK